MQQYGKEADFDSGEKPFVAHLREFRMRLIWSVIVLFLFFPICYYYYDFFVAFLTRPFVLLLGAQEEKSLFVNSVLEGFSSKIKISLLMSLIFSSPFHLYQALRFVLPALYPRERKIIISVLAISFFLVFASVYYSYEKIIPISIDFLLGAGFIPKDVGLLLNFQTNIFFIFQFIIAGLVVFQFPVLLLVLLALNILSLVWVKKMFRYIVVVVFLLAAMITPPDPISLLALALPLVGMFLGVVLIASIFRLGSH